MFNQDENKICYAQTFSVRTMKAEYKRIQNIYYSTTIVLDSLLNFKEKLMHMYA